MRPTNVSCHFERQVLYGVRWGSLVKDMKIGNPQLHLPSKRCRRAALQRRNAWLLACICHVGEYDRKKGWHYHAIAPSIISYLPEMKYQTSGAERFRSRLIPVALISLPLICCPATKDDGAYHRNVTGLSV